MCEKVILDLFNFVWNSLNSKGSVVCRESKWNEAVNGVLSSHAYTASFFCLKHRNAMQAQRGGREGGSGREREREGEREIGS